MPTLQFPFHGFWLEIRAEDPAWLAHYADYFSAYQVPQPPSEPTNVLQLELHPANAVSRPAASRLKQLAQTGILSLWLEATAPETLWLYAGATTFEIHPQAGRAIGYVDEIALAMPPILTNTYSLFALLLLLRWQGVYHLHAAAAQMPDGRLCWIAGPQRSGKTTLVTALGLSGWKPLGDDSLMLSWQGEQAVWQPLRKAFHLGNDVLEQWQTRLSGLPTQPRYLDRHSVAALKFFQTQELATQTFTHVDVLLFPHRQEATHTQIESLAPSEALRKLAEQSTFFPLWGHHTQSQWRVLLQLTAKAKSYAVSSGNDVLLQPEFIAQITAYSL